MKIMTEITIILSVLIMAVGVLTYLLVICHVNVGKNAVGSIYGSTYAAIPERVWCDVQQGYIACWDFGRDRYEVMCFTSSSFPRQSDECSDEDRAYAEERTSWLID